MMTALLAVYCEMHTTVVLAICAHNMLVDIKSHDVSKEHVEIMRCCRAAINDFEVALAHEHVNDLVSNDFGLFVPITLCKQWLGCMKIFSDCAVEFIIKTYWEYGSRKYQLCASTASQLPAWQRPCALPRCWPRGCTDSESGRIPLQCCSTVAMTCFVA